MTKTAIKLYDSGGVVIGAVLLSDKDATTQAIAQAAIDLIASRMSLHVGDTIKIIEE